MELNRTFMNSWQVLFQTSQLNTEKPRSYFSYLCLPQPCNNFMSYPKQRWQIRWVSIEWCHYGLRTTTGCRIGRLCRRTRLSALPDVGFCPARRTPCEDPAHTGCRNNLPVWTKHTAIFLDCWWMIYKKNYDNALVWIDQADACCWMVQTAYNVENKK